MKLRSGTDTGKSFKNGNIMRLRSGTGTRKSFKKTKHNDSSIGDLAKELQTEIFARVAKDSREDLTRCIFSCKMFKDIAEDGHIYRHVSLDNIPIASWDRNEKRRSFLRRCKQNGNPETMFRQAVVDYFGNVSTARACKYLDTAVGLGHRGAAYLSCIVLMYSGDEKLKEEAVKELSRMKKSNDGRRAVRMIRKTLKNHMKEIWVNYQKLYARPICCKSMEENHRKKLSWNADKYEDRLVEYEDSLECEACLADFELRCISGDLAGL